ncbi:3',5'-bisphosphate nucleotidase [Thozetella sp. PMI_491]|nr:3',5'-bisphosphate nucleotidase [Thozetella sp. PMI_491]
MDSPCKKELLVCFDVLQAAATLSRQVLLAADKGVQEKSDLSPVTIADFAIQALLTATIHGAFPDDKFVGEESADDLRANPVLLEQVWGLVQRAGQDAGPRSHLRAPASADEMCDMIDWCGAGNPLSDGASRVWVFDPIDGTKTFVRGELYAVNVCLIQDGKQQVATVACPLLSMDAQYPVLDHSVDLDGTGSILFAVRGHGTYVRPLPGSANQVQPRRVEPLPPTPSVAALRLVTCFDKSDSGVVEVHEGIAEALGIEFPGCDLLGWVPRWAVLALGLATMTVWVYKKKERRAKIWDHAGAMLLFEETGGKITDVNGRDMNITAGRLMADNYGFVAAPADVHQEVLAVVQDTVKAKGKGHLLSLE